MQELKLTNVSVQHLVLPQGPAALSSVSVATGQWRPGLTALDIPPGLTKLTLLELHNNRLASLPAGLTTLSHLEVLSLHSQAVEFQLDASFDVDALAALRMVSLSQGPNHTWSPESLFMLAEAQDRAQQAGRELALIASNTGAFSP